MSGAPLLNVVLYEPEIPQNTGNIGRTCAAVHAKLWLVQPLGFRMDQKSLRRAGLDYWEHLDWELVSDWPSLQQLLGKRPTWYFTKHSRQVYTEVLFEPGAVLVFGSETQGLPPSLIQAAAHRTLRIPMRGEVRSLNLANSVAVGVYEAVRQIGAKFEADSAT